ncbi:hypothetical protein CHS0354_038551 [Potamilus streckersoni]|uniref:Protein BANP n=1 Tax=Potamilus streckersoni TaxID=2493646 RepID=A0AAE0VIT9_9BIVA|nr:hypothetical protein CHS0354_038551 [Potamilus streckersoni]
MASEPGSSPQIVQIAVTGLMDTSHDLDDSVSVSETDQDSNSGEPSLKQRRTDFDYDFNVGSSVKQILFNINKAICMRLEGIESTLNHINHRTKELEEKMDQLLLLAKQNGSGMIMSPNNVKKGAVIVGLPQGGGKNEADQARLSGSSDGVQSLGPNVTLITLNSEEDYPNGTWLGDENNPEMRVRCHVTSSDLLHIHSNCRTPEKMALTLLDYLFDRETQASSNLSGMGKHGKKQLDPLMIYGIRCHLIHRFNITENDWHRIKQNMDSKCRTAFRRKQRGMSLTVKAFRGKTTSTYVSHSAVSIDSCIGQSDDESYQGDNELQIQGDVDMQHTVATMAGDGLPQGEIQILHATPEQISQLQQAHQIQILHGDQVIQVPVPAVSMVHHADIQDALNVSAGTEDINVTTTVTTETGEVVHIHQNDT